MFHRLLAALLIFLAPAAVTAQPSSLPDIGGSRPPASGTPYLIYRVLISPSGLEDWHRQYQALSREFAAESARADAYWATARQALERAEQLRASAREGEELQRQQQLAVESYQQAEMIASAYRARVDEAINPMMPALLADVEAFSRERGFAGTAPIFPEQYENLAVQIGLRDVTSDFVAWRRQRAR